MPSFQVELNASQIMAKSRQLSRIDMDDDDIKEALERLLLALNTEAQLSSEGAKHIQLRILNILCNRLRMQRDYKLHPEIDEQQIVKPYILTGAGRSGSTKLHKVMAASGDFKYLRFWQQYNPSLISGDRNEDPAERIASAHAFTQWFNQRVPNAKLIHSYETLEPEEETFLFDNSRFLINFNITHTSIPSYMAWVMSQDMAAQLGDLKRWLKYLQWQFFDGDERPWVLKNPLYSGMEPLLAHIFPGAQMIATHRDPAARVSSSAGLTVNFKQAYSDIDRTEEAGPGMLELMVNMANQYVAGRDAFPDVKILDVGYKALIKNSEAVIKEIFSFSNRELNDSVLQAVADWEEENRQHKHGVYKYSLDQFGITAEMIREKFDVYNKRFAEYL